jgi:PII-like signaling protein
MYPGWIDWQPELWDESVRRMDFSSTLREIESAFLLWRLSLSFLMAVGYLCRRQWGFACPFCCAIVIERAGRLSIIMEIPREAVLLRIFIGENHQFHHLPLYEAIVLKAREMHLAGATVLRGPMGFGKSSRLHVAKRFKISTDLPIVIEFVDSREKIEAFLPIVDTMMDSGLATLERAEVINQQPGPLEHRHSRRWGRSR